MSLSSIVRDTFVSVCVSAFILTHCDAGLLGKKQKKIKMYWFFWRVVHASKSAKVKVYYRGRINTSTIVGPFYFLLFFRVRVYYYNFLNFVTEVLLYILLMYIIIYF